MVVTRISMNFGCTPPHQEGGYYCCCCEFQTRARSNSLELTAGTPTPPNREQDGFILCTADNVIGPDGPHSAVKINGELTEWVLALGTKQHNSISRMTAAEIHSFVHASKLLKHRLSQQAYAKRVSKNSKIRKAKTVLKKAKRKAEKKLGEVCVRVADGDDGLDC